jgi:hypothetical protein
MISPVVRRPTLQILPNLHSILARDVVRQHGDELPEEPPLLFLRP